MFYRIKRSKRAYVIEPKREGNCPNKKDNNCLVPGGFNDSEPIGGA